jgi:hypothetical protein
MAYMPRDMERRVMIMHFLDSPFLSPHMNSIVGIISETLAAQDKGYESLKITKRKPSLFTKHSATIEP